MGVPICCFPENNKEINSEKNIIINFSSELQKKSSIIILIQKNIRRFLSQIKFESNFNSVKNIVIKELDKKKINE